jgi:tight adherence protein C
LTRTQQKIGRCTVSNDAFISMLVFLTVFFAVAGLCFVLYVRAPRDERKAVSRLRRLADGEQRAAADVPSSASLATTLIRFSRLLVPRQEGGPDDLKKRLIQAGFYSPIAPRLFLGTKLLLMLVLPMFFALAPHWLGLLGRKHVLLAGLAASCLGIWLPACWLGHQVKRRQRILRQALPDALDMLVLCLEGGVSLVAAFQRMTAELQAAHPVLGAEMNVLQREIQLGLSAGAALKKLGERCGLEDVRELANVLLQSERFGASVVKALRTHADSWRLERQQRAEEMAQKASVKILFPTLICIFPAIFIVVLGPAAFQMAKLFSK